MSRVRNATDFGQRFMQARDYYENHYKSRVDVVRAKLIGESKGAKIDSIDEILEEQMREYLINSLLSALNWKLEINSQNDFANLIPEAQLKSNKTGTTLRLDYLGLKEGGEPLLIVETKRPNSPLPRSTEISGKANLLPTNDSLKMIICSGLEGKSLSGEWNNWLDKLRLYLDSTKARIGSAPRRAVITNGEWLILFKDPDRSFLSTASPRLDDIIIYQKREEIIDNPTEIFEWLEYQRVLDEIPPCTEDDLSFYVTGSNITAAVHGLKLKYNESPGFFAVSPEIKVLPILLLKTTSNYWLQVISRVQIDMPLKTEGLKDHLLDVNHAAAELLLRVNKQLGLNLAPMTIESYFEDEESFDALPAVTYRKIKTHPPHDEYLIITGQNTHYFNLEPTVSDCPHHSFATNRNNSPVALVTIQTRSINPRSYFKDGENQYCNHSGVNSAKSKQITPQNKPYCGLRSGKDFTAFCEIWSFETRLCCRTCIYENVCTKTQVFNLPCS